MTRFNNLRPLQLMAGLERWSLRTPFTISGYTMTEIQCLAITLRRARHEGRGEAVGVYYHQDDPVEMLREVEAARATLERGIGRSDLQELSLSTGTKNALDCALWELQSKELGTPVWKLAGLPEPRPLMTTWTIGGDEPRRMAERAQLYAGARALKLKLLGDASDADRVNQVRKARPDVWLAVDANQGFTPDVLIELLPTLVAADVRLIEQPLPVGQDHELDRIKCPIPFAADESVQGIADVPAALGRYQYINIKLDKCGGLTAALQVAARAQTLGLKLMVGNMLGTSLAMAPAFLVGQLCDVVDLDGPLLLTADRTPAVSYADGFIRCPENVWGNGTATHSE